MVGVPLGALGARALSDFNARYLNFSIHSYAVPPHTLIAEAAAGFLIPLAAAVFPVLAGSRITVHQAIASYGLGDLESGGIWLDRGTQRLPWLSRPMALSLTRRSTRETRRRSSTGGIASAPSIPKSSDCSRIAHYYW